MSRDTVHEDIVWMLRTFHATGCTILGKAEFMNPGQSVKDRAALWIIRDAMRRPVGPWGGIPR